MPYFLLCAANSARFAEDSVQAAVPGAVAAQAVVQIAAHMIVRIFRQKKPNNIFSYSFFNFVFPKKEEYAILKHEVWKVNQERICQREIG